VSDNMQKHRDVAEALRELWPLIRDLPLLYGDARDAMSKGEAFDLGLIAQGRQDLYSAVSWYCLRVLGDTLPTGLEQEAKP
jgi:hypothetical protein